MKSQGVENIGVWCAAMCFYLLKMLLLCENTIVLYVMGQKDQETLPMIVSLACSVLCSFFYLNHLFVFYHTVKKPHQ